MSQPNTRIDDPAALDAALDIARGEYQRNVLRGIESLSGSTLRGRARNYSGKYAASRRNLLDRMTAAGVPWREERGAHGKRILVLGAEDPYAALPPMFPTLPCAA